MRGWGETIFGTIYHFSAIEQWNPDTNGGAEISWHGPRPQAPARPSGPGGARHPLPILEKGPIFPTKARYVYRKHGLLIHGAHSHIRVFHACADITTHQGDNFTCILPEIYA